MRILFQVPLSILAAFAIAGCASAPADEPVVTLPISEIKADASALPATGYVSTGQPDEDVLRAAAAAGYVAVVDLRTMDEPRGIDERALTEQLGMTYVSLPVGSPRDVTYENAAELDRVLAAMPGPVLLHCASGNRVGALFALRAKAAGASDEEALEKGRQAGLTRFEPVVRERLADGN